MAEATKSKVTKTTPKSTAKPQAAQVTEPAVESVIETPAKKTYKVRTQLDPHTIVEVKNGFPGLLIYVSSKTGELFRWEELGDEQDMELQELKNARNASKAFFENNWFMIDDPEILDYLGVTQYYKHAVRLENCDEILAMSPAEIEKTVPAMSSGQKLALKYRVKQLIATGELDSIKAITAFENALGVELIER